MPYVAPVVQTGAMTLPPASAGRRYISVAERRARLAVRHHLGAPAADVTAVAGSLVGLHSSDPVTVYLAARARLQGFAVADLEQALYEARSLVRVLGMRRTLFVLPRALAPMVNAACTRALAPAERQRLCRLLREQGIAAAAERWLADVEARVLAALADQGQATAKELTAAVPELALKLSFGEGRSWAGTVGISTRTLFLLATEARIIRARPRGSWISSQYRWAPAAAWLGEELARADPEAARAALLQHWLAAFGPGTLTDISWWTGWPVRQVRAALAAVGAVEVELDAVAVAPGSGPPGAGVPGGATPAGAARESGLPGAGVPGGATPAANAPGSAVPGSGDPRGAAPAAVAPGSAVPGPDDPGGAAPAAVAPGSAVPGPDDPGGAAPAAVAPAAAAAPGSAVPGAGVPGGATPAANAPGSAVPGPGDPRGAAPAASAPGSAVPGTGVPGGGVPVVTPAGSGLSRPVAPEAGARVTGFVAAGDLAPAPAVGHWCALLPALDPTVMGWKERSWYLGAAAQRQLFDRNGNAGPTVWADGRVVGGWAQRRDGAVAVELLEPVDAAMRERIDAEAANLSEWLDGTVVTPRFRTPLEKRLASA